MVKRVFTVVAGITFLCALGGFIYADTCGLFVQNNEAAMQLVDRYMSFVMKNYDASEEKVSFRGIVKEGCDFWYFNDYNSRKIAENHCKGSGFEIEKADYSIEYDSVEYNNKHYTIDATVTQEVKYKDYPEEVTSTSKHTFTIEQHGNMMYIVNDVTKAKGDALIPSEVKSGVKKETPTEPLRSDCPATSDKTIRR